jgi:DNA-binding NarL/FixJ family response regulator
MGFMNAISIALIDDHPLMIEALSSLLKSIEGFGVVGTGTTAFDVVEICRQTHPEIAVVDLSVPGDVYGAIANAIKISPSTKIVVFTAATGVETAIRALDAGARGYVLKGSTTSELIQAIFSVQSGETYITQGFASRVIAGLRNVSLRRKAAEAVGFSIREDQIVRLLLRGFTNKAIAASLKISEKTVKNYMTILMQKLSARSRLEVVIAAQKLTERELHHSVGTARSHPRLVS